MIKEITMFEFNEFSNSHPYGSFYQSSEYAILAAEDDFDYDYIGYFINNKLVAASLILIKKISFITKYGYAPRGFIIDFNNFDLLKDFTNKVKDFYKKKLIFIKIDPLIITKQYNNKYNLLWQTNSGFLNNFQMLGYKKLKDNLYFESQLPRFEAVVDLKNFKKDFLAKNTRNKVNKAIKKGLNFEKVSLDNIDIFYKFIKNKKEKSFNYYNNLCRIFSKNNLVDLFLVKVDYEQFMENAKKNYEEELTRNTEFNNLLKIYNNDKNLNKKMISDRLLVTYKNDIMEASGKYRDNQLHEYIAGALVIKHKNCAYIISSGYDPHFRHLSANYFLYYKLIEYYKNEYDFLYLNGISGNFKNDTQFYGLNKFKLGFNPNIYEYIGELDLIIDEKKYNNLLLTGKLHKEFDLR